MVIPMTQTPEIKREQKYRSDARRARAYEIVKRQASETIDPATGQPFWNPADRQDLSGVDEFMAAVEAGRVKLRSE